MKVRHHKFTGSMPLIFVEKFEDFGKSVGMSLDELEQSDVMGTTQNFCKFVRIKGSPLKFVVFNESMMRTMFGKVNEQIVEATLAIYEGKKKYPMNEKLSLNHALKLALRHERYDTFRLLRTHYENTFEVSCPFELPSNAIEELLSPTKKGSASPGKSKIKWEKTKDGHAAANGRLQVSYGFVGNNNGYRGENKELAWKISIDGKRESLGGRGFRTLADAKKRAEKLISSGFKDLKESVLVEKPASQQNTKKRPGRHSRPERETGKNTQYDPEKKGFTHVKGGEGNLYVKGEHDPKKAQRIANSRGADHQWVNGKMVPISGNPLKTQGTDGEDPQGQQGAEQGAQPKQTVKMVDRDSDVEKMVGTTSRKSSAQSSTRTDLAAPYEGEKNKEVDTKVAKGVAKSEAFASSLGVSDQEFEANNKDLWVSRTERMTIDHGAFDTAIPKSSVQLLERLVNTRFTSKTTQISHFADPNSAGAGEIRSQAGELAMMTLMSLNDDHAEIVFNDMAKFIEETGDKSILTKEWLVAAAQNRKATRKMFDQKYGEGNWAVQASGWDNQSQFEAMTGLDYGNKGDSTDVFFTVVDRDGNARLEEISLKKDLNTFLLNSGAKFFTEVDPSLEGSDVDVAKFRSREFELLQEAMAQNPRRDATRLMNKNPDHPTVVEIRKSMERAGVRSLNAAMDKMGNLEARRALFLASKLLAENGNKKAKKHMKLAAQRYDEFALAAVTEIGKNQKLNDAMMKDIRQKLPLRSVAESEETIIAADQSIDRATMKNIFGTNDPDSIMDKLSVYESPPPAFLGYAVGPKDNPIPVATIGFRASGVGYGGRIKFDMKMHEEFKRRVEEANGVVYGGEA